MKKINLILLISLAVFLMSCNNTEQQTPVVKSNSDAVIENIMNRRSIRSYKADQISDEELNKIIECGMNAPSALNKQPWEVRVIQDAELISTINNGFVEYAKGLHFEGSASRSQEAGFSVFHGAPTVIVVAADESATSHVDCGLLGQNILLSAESMNIGTCVIGGILPYLNTPEVVENIIPQLELSQGYSPLYCIAVGYKNESPNAKPRDMSKVKFIK